MKIAHIVCTFPPYFGGMGNVVFQTVNALINLGHDAQVFTVGYNQERPEVIEPQKAYVTKYSPKLQFGNAAYIPQLRNILHTFDIVHLHYPFYGTANLIRKWKMAYPDIPLVITYHMDNRAVGWKGLYFMYYNLFWMPKILGAADLLIGSSKDYIDASGASVLQKQFPEKWQYIPFGVDCNRFSPGKKSTSLQESIGLESDVPTILFVGGMDNAHYFKGVPILLKALCILKKQNLPFQAVFVGEGELKNGFVQESRGMGLATHVHFVGRVEDEALPQYYRLADVFVLPAINQAEAFGMVLLEAMASGVPVITSDLPGVRTVPKDAGVVFPPKNYVALAQCIQELFLNPELLAEKKAEARRVAQEVYSWDAITKTLEKEYHNLVGDA